MLLFLLVTNKPNKLSWVSGDRPSAAGYPNSKHHLALQPLERVKCEQLHRPCAVPVGVPVDLLRADAIVAQCSGDPLQVPLLR